MKDRGTGGKREVERGKMGSRQGGRVMGRGRRQCWGEEMGWK